MDDRVVYTTLCLLAGRATESLDTLLEMAALWAAHLRGPARFDGRVVIMSNAPRTGIGGVEWVRVPIEVADRRELFLERVRCYRALDVRPQDRVMQLDLDALAVAPLDPLFDRLTRGWLHAAPSRLSPLAHEHAGSLMSRCERWMYRLRGWSRRRGVSACVTACWGEDWPRLMGRWTALIRRRGRGPAVPQLGDQSFLNYLYMTGAASVARFPGALIYHVRQPGISTDDETARRAVILHFPMAQRLDEMRRWSRT